MQIEARNALLLELVRWAAACASTRIAKTTAYWYGLRGGFWNQRARCAKPITIFFLGVFEKRLELLKQVRPQATTFGYLLNAANPANQFRKPVDDAAQALGLKLEIVELNCLGLLM